MADCPNMPTCRMYPMFSLAGSLEVWKQNYCTADFSRCARFQQTCEARTVPDNLLPNGALLKKATR